MRITLRNLFLASAMMATAALATTAAKADVTLNVPFAFKVNGTHCPAGRYTVTKDAFQGVVILKSQDAPRTFRWLLTPGDGALPSSKISLKFDPQGETHALRSIQFGTLTTARLDKKEGRNEHRQVQTIEGQGR
jgi:hypothetical protein